MSSNDIGKKKRLQYVYNTYFRSDISMSELHRRISGDKGQDTKPFLILQDDSVSVERRTLDTWFKDGKPVPRPSVIRAICTAFARHFVYHNKTSNKDTLDADAREKSKALFEYIENMKGSPLSILFDHNLPFFELSFEHEETICSKHEHGQADNPFSKLAGAIGYEPTAREYLRGGEPKHWGVLRQVAIERPAERDLLELLNAGQQLIVLTGAAGDGKTTILKRVAMASRQHGRRVFWANALNRKPFPSLPSCMGNADVPTCIFIDNADMATGYPYLEEDLTNYQNLQIVLCARTHCWLQKSISFSRYSSIEITTLSENESEEIAKKILKYKATDRETDVATLVTDIRTSVASDEPHLLAAMMTATRGIAFPQIVESMITQFVEAEDDLALRVIACGSLIHELSGGKVGRITHRLFKKIIHDNTTANRHSEYLKYMKRISGEIVQINISDHSYGEYDLRHPYITQSVLNYFYGLDYGKPIKNGDALAYDLCTIISSDMSPEVVENIKNNNGLHRNYSYKICTMLILLDTNIYRCIPRIICRDVYRYFIDRFGNTEHEKTLRAYCLFMWACAEINSPSKGSEDNNSRLLHNSLFEEAVRIDHDFSQAWLKWADVAERDGHIGDFLYPEQDSAGWIFRKAWESGVRDANLLQHWAEFEDRRGNLGDFNEPENHTACWIFRKAWESGIRDANLLLHWARFEEKRGNIGDLSAPDKYTSCWILHSSGHRKASIVLSRLESTLTGEVNS